MPRTSALGSEDYRFVRVSERGHRGLKFGYLAVYAAGARQPVPYFLTDYRLNTLVTSPLLKWLLAPLSFKIACRHLRRTPAG
jgi:hypothetical protein